MSTSFADFLALNGMRAEEVGQADPEPIEGQMTVDDVLAFAWSEGEQQRLDLAS